MHARRKWALVVGQYFLLFIVLAQYSSLSLIKAIRDCTEKNTALEVDNCTENARERSLSPVSAHSVWLPRSGNHYDAVLRTQPRFQDGIPKPADPCWALSRCVSPFFSAIVCATIQHVLPRTPNDLFFPACLEKRTPNRRGAKTATT